MKQDDKVRMWSMAAAAALSALPANAQLALVPGDVNGDGIVNGQDIAMVASNWGDGYGPGDANGDSIVNGQDIALIASNWLKTGPTLQQVVDSLPPPPASAYTSGYNAASLQQIGLTQSIAASGKYGDGVTIGVVDSGIQVSDPGFYGRISPLSTCVNGYLESFNSIGCVAGEGIDGWGSHGEVVASVAAGANPLQIGVAPKAIVDVVKSCDCELGIEAAADSGAKVINVSLQGALRGTEAINYAASKGATVVIAAGNSGSPYFDVLAVPGQSYITVDGRNYSVFAGGEYGFTPQALSHIIVVGGVTSANVAETYSNIPGSDFLGTTGTQTIAWNEACGCDIGINNSTGPVAALQSRWLMAPDQVPNEGAGTSYAAPVVAGAVALLDSRWPILVQNGTTAQVLFETATPLGDPSIYGNGLLNLQAAFQPLGQLSVMTGGGSVSVDQVVASIKAGGPLGAMQAIQAGLTNYTVFDSFSRDFKENLSYLISYKPSAPSVVQAVTAPQAKTSSVHLTDGSSLSFGN